jgi:hypothetical protein
MEGFFADPVYGGNREMVSWLQQFVLLLRRQVSEVFI